MSYTQLSCPGCGQILRSNSGLGLTWNVGCPYLKCDRCGAVVVETTVREWAQYSFMRKLTFILPLAFAAVLLTVLGLVLIPYFGAVLGLLPIGYGVYKIKNSQDRMRDPAYVERMRRDGILDLYSPARPSNAASPLSGQAAATPEAIPTRRGGAGNALYTGLLIVIPMVFIIRGAIYPSYVEAKDLAEHGTRATAIVESSRENHYLHKKEERVSYVHVLSYDGHEWQGTLAELHSPGEELPALYDQRRPKKVMVAEHGETLEQKSQARARSTLYILLGSGALLLIGVGITAKALFRLVTAR